MTLLRTVVPEVEEAPNARLGQHSAGRLPGDSLAGNRSRGGQVEKTVVETRSASAASRAGRVRGRDTWLHQRQTACVE